MQMCLSHSSPRAPKCSLSHVVAYAQSRLRMDMNDAAQKIRLLEQDVVCYQCATKHSCLRVNPIESKGFNSKQARIGSQEPQH